MSKDGYEKNWPVKRVYFRACRDRGKTINIDRPVIYTQQTRDCTLGSSFLKIFFQSVTFNNSSVGSSIFTFPLRLGSWVFKWAFMLHPSANRLPHMWHSCGFCPVKYSFLKRLVLESQSINNSPVCKKRWFFKLVTLLNPLSQMWHRCGQDPLCMYIWDFKSPGVGNDFWHRSHLCGFSCN